MSTINTMQRSVAITLLAVSMFAAPGCAAPPKVDINATPAEANPDDYPQIFKTWSREVSVLPFNGLDNILTARATYLSREFRAYYAERRAADLDASPEDKRTIDVAAFERAEAGHEFYVTLMSAVADCDDLTEEGPWTIRLKNDKGVEATPMSVEEIDNPLPSDIKYFSFDPKLRKAYRVMFPLTDENGGPVIDGRTQFFELSFATAYGKDAVRWEMK